MVYRDPQGNEAPGFAPGALYLGNCRAGSVVFPDGSPHKRIKVLEQYKGSTLVKLATRGVREFVTADGTNVRIKKSSKRTTLSRGCAVRRWHER